MARLAPRSESRERLRKCVPRGGKIGLGSPLQICDLPDRLAAMGQTASFGDDVSAKGCVVGYDQAFIDSFYFKAPVFGWGPSPAYLINLQEGIGHIFFCFVMKTTAASLYQRDNPVPAFLTRTS